MTGWVNGQIFLQTVDEAEVQQVNAFLSARNIASQVLTASERISLDPQDPASAVTANSYSIAIQLAGFPQVVSPVLAEIIQRAHGAGWDIEPAAPTD